MIGLFRTLIFLSIFIFTQRSFAHCSSIISLLSPTFNTHVIGIFSGIRQSINMPSSPVALSDFSYYDQLIDEHVLQPPQADPPQVHPIKIKFSKIYCETPDAKTLKIEGIMYIYDESDYSSFEIIPIKGDLLFPSLNRKDYPHEWVINLAGFPTEGTFGKLVEKITFSGILSFLRQPTRLQGNYSLYFIEDIPFKESTPFYDRLNKQISANHAN